MSKFPIGRPRFVSAADALGFQAIAIERFGGAEGLRDRGLLESALAVPMQGFAGEYAYSYPFGMAAAYAFHISKNHPFIDGNKRAALMCCGGFLRMNGWDLDSDGESAADAIVALVTDQWDKARMEGWLQANCRERTSFELRDFFAMADGAKYKMLVKSMQAARLVETLASVNETATAMPFASELVSVLNDLAESERQTDLGQGALNDLLLLTALYRLAEDMGYEW